MIVLKQEIQTETRNNVRTKIKINKSVSDYKNLYEIFNLLLKLY